jgi:hypothetical protein
MDNPDVRPLPETHASAARAGHPVKWLAVSIVAAALLLASAGVVIAGRPHEHCVKSDSLFGGFSCVRTGWFWSGPSQEVPKSGSPPKQDTVASSFDDFGTYCATDSQKFVSDSDTRLRCP